MAFTDRPRIVRAAALDDRTLDAAPLAPEQLVGDATDQPAVRVLELHDGDDLVVGIWQHGAGVSTDVESDEVFVVLSGRATIEFPDDPAASITCGPGDVVMLPAGARTRWTVHETLRKIYVIRPAPAS